MTTTLSCRFVMPGGVRAYSSTDRRTRLEKRPQTIPRDTRAVPGAKKKSQWRCEDCFFGLLGQRSQQRCKEFVCLAKDRNRGAKIRAAKTSQRQSRWVTPHPSVITSEPSESDFLTIDRLMQQSSPIVTCSHETILVVSLA